MSESTVNVSYVGYRPDIENLLGPDVQSVLDVGCSTGNLGKSIKQNHGANVIGIEMSEDLSAIAKSHLDKVIVGDATSILLSDKLNAYQFDTIIFADILEHLIDPWSTLKAATGYLANDGCIIVSIPNVRFIGTIFNLIIKGDWPYRERGIHDKTHLRFFTFKAIKKMIRYADCKIIRIKRNYRIIDKPHRINKIAKYLALPYVKDFLTYQFLLVCKKEERS